jgi:hypothetical protein
MNNYHEYISDLLRLQREARSVTLGGYPPAPRPALPADAPAALFFSPHPDDECISGGPALRLFRQGGMRVSNVAVTLGSNKARQAGRWQELTGACEYMGIGLIPTGPSGMDRINPKTRESDPAYWQDCVRVIEGILRQHQPRVVFFPHDRDWNSTHVGTHLLVTDALRAMPSDYSCYCVETEFWGVMADPNFMVEIAAHDVADMITAISFHVGEVNRNPYHLSLAAWMMDNVRRGAEVVGGQGGAVPDFAFAALCRLRRWQAGGLQPVLSRGTVVPMTTNLASLFA